ncbi:hypothetical protein [Bradyrhizobium sp. 153]|uniref:hypothetical protein n=1 Tax=Bradyrhizobium sp. 153 TaxID=2782627 RepID=UPI001FF927AD|nr:hypothetical protein [Bradyrhizobium sp. 153]MCK1665234.1 hypothetical protein [Bradyrhizobium sp. 153]
MSNIALSQKAQKLMRLCDLSGFDRVDDLLLAMVLKDTSCPAICTTEGCDHTADMEPDQDQGFCEVCGGNTLLSVLVLADLI